MFDFIGDIHGHADELEALLLKMGYTHAQGTYSHPTRKAFFVGDYIDRGPKIRETLQIVKAMVDSGNAIALMGNHEYNALCFHMHHKEGGHLRKHLIKNIVQHYETLKQFQNRQEEYDAYMAWFKTLPLYYETDQFRAVHACWDDANIAYLRNTLADDRLTDELIHASAERGSKLYEVIEQSLKGKEMQMPEGLSFLDKDGTKRTAIRIKWWEDPTQMSYRSISVLPIEDLPEEPIDLAEPDDRRFYPEGDKIVFFGHYWLKGEPAFYRDNICCLDYSVAKGGALVAYRLGEETTLMKGNLVSV